MGVVSKLHGVLPDSVSMAASNRLDPRTVIVCRGLLAYAWVPSQEDLHRLWRADELQAGPKHKKKVRRETPYQREAPKACTVGAPTKTFFLYSA